MFPPGGAGVESFVKNEDPKVKFPRIGLLCGRSMETYDENAP